MTLSVFLLHYSENKVKSFQKELDTPWGQQLNRHSQHVLRSIWWFVLCMWLGWNLFPKPTLLYDGQIQLLQRGAEVRSGRPKNSSPAALTRGWWSSLLTYTRPWCVPACPSSPAFCIQHLPGCWHFYPPEAGATTRAFTEVVTSQRQQLPADFHAGLPLAVQPGDSKCLGYQVDCFSDDPTVISDVQWNGNFHNCVMSNLCNKCLTP